MGKILNYVHSHIILILVVSATGGLIGCQNQQGVEVVDEQIVPSSIPSATPIPLTDLAFATLAPPTIEVIQQTPTPLPTATPTPTATPILYTIQEGDTLLAIAIDNRTTVDEIQSLNPNVRAELLSIGQEITLPPPATPIFSNDQPTALPIAIEVLSTSLFPDGAGGLWVIGEVKNSADYSIENLQLEIILYGEGGLVVGQKKTWAPAPQIPPNESTPFGVLFPQKPEGNLQTEIKVASGFAIANISEGDRYYFGITADEPQFTTDGEAIKVSGTITNSGSETAIDSVGLISTYDISGRLIGYGQITFSPTIPPGEQEIYSGTFLPLAGEASSVKIQTYAKK